MESTGGRYVTIPRGALSRLLVEKITGSAEIILEDEIHTLRECEDCVKIGAKWVHLRTCQECGGTRCCDDSPNKHASKHARSIKHPVIASAEPGERWLYCYDDDAFAGY